MRKLILILAMMLPIVFVSCSDNGSDDNPNNPPQDEPLSIIGTWEYGDYFVSFGEDGFCCSYLDDEFIDSGDYEQSGDKVTCSNSYFNRNTIFKIKNMTETKMSVEISYMNLSGKNESRNMVLAKSSAEPVSKENPLVGRSISWNTYDTFGIISMNFDTYNSGEKTASKGSAKEYPLDFFYIYVNGKMYYQILQNNSIQVPSIGGWSTNYGDVCCWNITISPDGGISFEAVDL